MKIIITGSSGMIGSYVVKELIKNGHNIIGLDQRDNSWNHKNFKQIIVDLSNIAKLEKIFEDEKPDRVIHLAALAHTVGTKNLGWKHYELINIKCTENIALIAEKYHCGLLFISTVDAIGMVKDIITPEVHLNPVSNYGKSKAIAETIVMKVCKHYNIFRFSPVYTKNNKRDIQKRYYLKYPNWAYKIVKGEKFEVLNINRAVDMIAYWTNSDIDNKTHIIKDAELLDVNKTISYEKVEGRSLHVITFPRWAVLLGYYLLRCVLGKSNKTYLIFKALWPYRSINTL